MDCAGGGVKVMEGEICAGVNVGDEVSVFVGVTGVFAIMPGVCVYGSVRIMGVAETIPGVREGSAVKTGKGWGCTSQMSQALRKITEIIERRDDFFMESLYPS
jgi:hypothetical protein